MDGWKQWIGKKVFLRTKEDRVYSGSVEKVQIFDNALCFITFKDKFGMIVTVANSEIREIREEK